MAKRAALREKATAELVNIDDEERTKRKLIGAGAGVVALVAAVGLSVGGVTNPLIRGAVMYLVRASAHSLLSMRLRDKQHPVADAAHAACVGCHTPQPLAMSFGLYGSGQKGL